MSGEDVLGIQNGSTVGVGRGPNTAQNGRTDRYSEEIGITRRRRIGTDRLRRPFQWHVEKFVEG